MFSWQATLNPFVASFFDVGKGRVHCFYLGSNNKNTLERWLVQIQCWIPLIRAEVRLSQRLESTYELKIWVNNSDRETVDEAIGFLAECYQPKKSPAYCLQSRLEDCPVSSLQGQAYHLACSLEDGQLQAGDCVTHFRRPEHGMLVVKIEGDTAIIREFRFTSTENFRETVDWQYPLSELTRQPLRSAIALVLFEQRRKALEAEKRLTRTQIEALASLAR